MPTERRTAVTFPKIILAAVLIAAGLLAPAITRLQHPAPGTIGMTHYSYLTITKAEQIEIGADGTPVITIHAGDTLSFQNNSRWIHIVGSGDKGLLKPHDHAAMTSRHMLEENSSYTTPPWTTPGTYQITCTVHPSMNATVVVLP
jgi:plastocyanin